MERPLVNPKNENEKSIKQQLEHINRIEINVTFPFLMKVYQDYSKEIIDKQTFISVLLLIQSFVFKRFIVGLPTNALSKIFMSLYDEVEKENYIFSIQNTYFILTNISNAEKFEKNKTNINSIQS